MSRRPKSSEKQKEIYAEKTKEEKAINIEAVKSNEKVSKTLISRC